jgi:hypothetical protein
MINDECFPEDFPILNCLLHVLPSVRFHLRQNIHIFFFEFLSRPLVPQMKKVEALDGLHQNLGLLSCCRMFKFRLRIVHAADGGRGEGESLRFHGI